MGEWKEKGPFRVRVVQVAAAKEKSFRESAAPDEVHEICWGDSVKKETSRGPLLPVLSAVVVIVALTALFVLQQQSEWYAAPAFFVVAFLALARSRRIAVVRDRESSNTHRLVVDPSEIAFEDGAKRHAFPRARIAVEARTIGGRHRAVLVSDDEELVLFDSHHEMEVNWLVDKLEEALAR